MSDAFDPYHKWLGIPPRDQPPNYYRLLGVDLLEEDHDVIENAADQRMGHVRSFQNGSHGAQSQRILNELAAAKICLLNPDQKRIYDERLSQTTPSQTAEEATATQAEPTQLMPELTAASTTSAAAKKRKKSKKPGAEIAKHVAASLAGIAISYLILAFLRPEWDTLGIAKWARSKPAGVAKNQVDPPATSPNVVAPPPPTVVKPPPVTAVKPVEKPETDAKPSGPPPPASPDALRKLVVLKQEGWQWDGKPKTLGPVSESFAALSSVGGFFLGDGEWIRFDRDQSGRWHVQGGAVKHIGMTCLEVKTPVRWLFEENVVKHRWNRGAEPIKLIHQHDGFAVLSSVTGCFLDGAQGVRVYLDKDGFWYLNGRTNFKSSGEAIVYRYREPGKFRAQVEEHRWSAGDAPRELLHESEGLCFLSGVEGGFTGWHAIFYCQVDKQSQRWVFKGGHSTDKTLHAHCISLKFPTDVMQLALSAQRPQVAELPAATGTATAGKQPVPDGAAQAAAHAKLADVLEGNAHELASAAKTQTSATERYVLLQTSRFKAIADGDATHALACVQELSTAFEIDSQVVLKTTLDGLLQTVETPAAATALTQAALTELDKALTAGRTEDAESLAVLALTAARKSDNPDLQKRVTLKLIEMRKP